MSLRAARYLLITTINSARADQTCFQLVLALKISLGQWIADLCEKIGANVEEVTHAMGLDSRIGTQFLRGGWVSAVLFSEGFAAFIHLAGTVASILTSESGERVNSQRIDKFFDKSAQRSG